MITGLLIEELPPEIILKIFNFLFYEDQKNFNLSAHSIHHQIEDEFYQNSLAIKFGISVSRTEAKDRWLSSKPLGIFSNKLKSFSSLEQQNNKPVKNPIEAFQAIKNVIIEFEKKFG